MRFYCVDGVGHAALEVTIEDDDVYHTPGTAKFSFRFEPGELDRFLERLRVVEIKKCGEATLHAAV